MSKCYSSTSSPPRKKRAKQSRSLSASEIARNAKHFDTWSAYQGCECVAFSDQPPKLKDLVDRIFDTSARLPRAWVDKTSDASVQLRQIASSQFVRFLDLAYEMCPELFSDAVVPEDCPRLLDDIRSVFLAWDRLQKLRESQAKVSEATMVANVYEVLRSPAAATSLYRSKCSISLAQPLAHLPIPSSALRILNATTVIPDAALFVPPSSLHALSHPARAPFKRLKRKCAPGVFAPQATPCTALPALPAFEAAASFWEDKKAAHPLLEDAYRQNRMATAASARQLHALRTHMPLVGLIWADGTVRAHVDWASGGWDEQPTVHSAPYPGARPADASASVFHEWRLDEPADALKVFLLIRSIDAYTTGAFADAVSAGIRALERAVDDGARFRPWKRTGPLAATPLQEQRVNNNGETSVDHTPEKRKVRRRRRKSGSA